MTISITIKENMSIPEGYYGCNLTMCISISVKENNANWYYFINKFLPFWGAEMYMIKKIRDGHFMRYLLYLDKASWSVKLIAVFILYSTDEISSNVFNETSAYDY